MLSSILPLLLVICWNSLNGHDNFIWTNLYSYDTMISHRGVMISLNITHLRRVRKKLIQLDLLSGFHAGKWELGNELNKYAPNQADEQGT